METILRTSYVDAPVLAPTPEILKAYKSGAIDWETYEREYRTLLISRESELRDQVPSWGSNPVLICSEFLPHNCHRRLAAEYIHELGLGGIPEHLVR